MSNQDQIHPRSAKDRTVVNNLLQAQPDDYNLAELARLLIRYQGFPGARDIQQNLQQVLAKWQLTEDALFVKTRAIHNQTRVFSDRFKGDQKQDWT